MAARRLARSLAVAVLLVAVPALLPPSAGAVSAIPQRHAGTILPGNALSAVVGDVDGDGTRELVRLVPLPEDELHLGVEVVRMRGDAPQLLAPVALRRSYAVEEVTEAQAVPDEENKVAARVDEPARLVVWRVDGRERVLAVAIGNPVSPRPCCITAWEVGVAGASTTLTLVADPTRSAAAVRMTDMDADGTDELVVLEPPMASLPRQLPVDVLRWTGARFEAVEGGIGPVGDGTPTLIPLGDSDGLPGDEVGVLTRTGGTPSLVVLHRIALAADGSLRTDTSPLSFEGRLLGMDGPDGGRLVLSAPPVGVRLLSWPAGEDRAVLEAESNRQGLPVATLGSGPDARLLLVRQGTLDVLDAGLAPIQGITVGPAAGRPRGTDLLPYVGMLPGGLGEEQVLIFGGRLVRPRSPALGSFRLLRTQPIASLPGMTPIGTFGAGQGWMALAAGELEARPDGGQLSQPTAGPRGVPMSVAATGAVLQQEADFGWLEPRVHGATVTGAAARPSIRTRSDFEVLLAAPPGTTVHAYVAGEEVEPLLVGASGEGVLPVDVPDPGTDGRSRFALRVLAVTPSGHGYGGVWPVNVNRSEPELDVSARSQLGFSAEISGTASPNSTLSVDGDQVAIDADGTFSAQVSAGLLPRSVEIRAVDPLGNTAERVVSVVAPLDYRALPWIPIVAVLTILAGLLLYIRTPRPAAAMPAGRRPEEGTLEEIE